MASELKIQNWLRDIERLDREITDLIQGEHTTRAYSMCMERLRSRNSIAQNLADEGIDVPELPIRGLV